MNEILKCLMTFATEILPVIVLGIVFFALRKNTSWKKFWLVLGLLLPAFVVFRSVQWLACKNDLEMAIEGLFLLALYVLGAFIGNFFKTKKILYVIAVSVIVLLLFLAFKWIVDYDSEMHPFGTIVDEPLSQDLMKNAEHLDYEIRIKQTDAWGHNAFVSAIRVKGDSVYACLLRSACGVSFSSLDSCEWKTLPSEELPGTRTQVQALKDSIEAYRQELIPYGVFDGCFFEITLINYRQGVKRYLEIGNAMIGAPTDVPQAKRLEKMAEAFLLPLDTSAAYRDSIERCFELDKQDRGGEL